MQEVLRHLPRTLHGRLIAAKLAAIAVLVIVLAEVSLVARLETELTQTIHGLTVGWLTGLVSGVTELGGTTIVLGVTAVAVLALVALRHWRGAVALAIAVLGTQLAVSVGKVLMTRPRPDDGSAVADPSGWSFPSGHSASAAALYVMLALIATTLWRRQLRPAVAFAVAGTLVAVVGLSRVYLGAHYPTDVLAGWLVGGVLVVGAWAACSRLPAPQLRAA
ncbi:MAG: phosphatase PAP2 family protein [Solirubrobacterales bacterium]